MPHSMLPFKCLIPLSLFFSKKGILVEFSGSYSNEIWPKVHEYLSTKMQANQYTVYK